MQVSDVLPLQPAVCAGVGARSRGLGRKVGTLVPQIYLPFPYSHFQLLLVAPPLVSSLPASSGCPSAASGKSQPLSRATGGNWSLSSITGAASREGFLPILASLWLLYCSFTAKRPVASCPPARQLQSQSQTPSGYSLWPQKLLILSSQGHRFNWKVE